jgi:hypothetical protein
MMTMPFGKYRGTRLEDVPSDYLRWCLDDCDFVASRPRLRAAIAAEWQRRLNPPPPPSADATVRPILLEFVRAGFRALVQRHHPDHHGGDHTAMVRVNQQAETLRRGGWL